MFQKIKITKTKNRENRDREMSEAKDLVIKLFGKTIPVPEVQANGSGECSGAPSSCSGPLVDDNIDQDRASSSNSSAEKVCV